jgi:hypothetical protein
VTTPSRERWQRGVERELAFWRSYFASGGLDWPDEYAARLNPDLPLQDVIAKHLQSGQRARVLDCAAGPATTVGKTFNGERIELVAVDALADEYAALLAEFRIEPPVPTRRFGSRR